MLNDIVLITVLHGVRMRCTEYCWLFVVFFVLKWLV